MSVRLNGWTLLGVTLLAGAVCGVLVGVIQALLVARSGLGLPVGGGG